MLNDGAFLYFTCVFLVARPFLWYQGQGHLLVSRSHVSKDDLYRGTSVSQTHLEENSSSKTGKFFLENGASPTLLPFSDFFPIGLSLMPEYFHV